MRYDNLPRLNLPIWAFPDGEQRAIWHISMLVSELDRYIERFEATLELFKYANGLVGSMQIAIELANDQDRYERIRALMTSPVREWCHIAARDSSLTIFHFGKTLHALMFPNCPTLRSRLDLNGLKLAKTLFSKRFPHWELIRHAVAHSAEGVETLEKRIENSYVTTSPCEIAGMKLGRNSTLFLGGALHGEKYIWTWASANSKAQIVSTECSERALSYLVDIRMRTNQAFDLACHYAFQCLHEDTAKTDPEEPTQPKQD